MAPALKYRNVLKLIEKKSKTVLDAAHKKMKELKI